MKKLLITLVLLGVSVAVAQQVPQMVVRLPHSAPTVENVSLQGIAMMGGERYAAFSFMSGPGAWRKAGQTIGRFNIASVDENSVKLVNPETNAEFTKLLGEGTVKESEKEKEPARYSRAWINSKANPMLYHMLSLPTDIAMNWSKLPGEQKEEVIAYYRLHGWQLRHTETYNGLTSEFEWDNIYQKERQAVIKANGEAFEASLNDEQRAVWNAIRATPALRFTEQKRPTDEDYAEGQRRRDRFKAFQATLSPEQLAALNARTDFTKHDWSKE